MSGWSAAATSALSRSLSSSQDQTITQTRKRRRWPSSKRPEPPMTSPTNEAPPSYTTSRDLTRAKRFRRDAAAHRRFAKAVKERDGYRCQECGSTERLIAHHVIPLQEGGTH